jgi:hypothetical protein
MDLNKIATKIASNSLGYKESDEYSIHSMGRAFYDIDKYSYDMLAYELMVLEARKEIEARRDN